MHRFMSFSFALLLLAGCARFGLGGAGGGGGGASGPEADEPVNLAGTWQLSRGTGPNGALHIPSGYTVTIAFEDGRVSGQACNMYGGDYRLDDDGSLTLSAMAMTEMACQEPMMTLEADYHAALAQVRNAAVAQGELTLSGDGAELVYTRVPPVGDADLVGTRWTLTTLILGDAASSVVGEGWLQLNPDGTVRGNTGCRGFDGRYEVNGDRLSITNLVTEDNACEPLAAEQDATVLDLLRGGISYRIEGRQLTLTGAGIVGGPGLAYSAPDA